MLLKFWNTEYPRGILKCGGCMGLSRFMLHSINYCAAKAACRWGTETAAMRTAVTERQASTAATRIWSIGCWGDGLMDPSYDSLQDRRIAAELLDSHFVSTWLDIASMSTADTHLRCMYLCHLTCHMFSLDSLVSTSRRPKKMGPSGGFTVSHGAQHLPGSPHRWSRQQSKLLHKNLSKDEGSWGSGIPKIQNFKRR